MSWTVERIEQVRVMWLDGYSAAQIARVLGAGISRNAVIGIIHRRGFANRKAPSKPFIQKPFVQKKTFIAPVEEAPVAVTIPNPIPGVTMLNVGPRQCRWPYGDPGKSDFHLCGHQTLVDSPYCLAHMRKAHAPGYVRARQDDAQEEIAEIYKRERIFA